MTCQSNEPEPWKNSKAKAHLKQLLESDDTYMEMPEAELYLLSPDLFGQYREDRFVCNVKNLKKSIKDDKNQSTLQEAALVHDRQLFPKSPVTFWGYGRWDESEAKTQLRKDVRNNKQKTMKPAELRESRIEVYGQFPLGVFRKHIYQEEYAQTGRSYWMHKKEEKKKKETEAKKKKKKKPKGRHPQGDSAPEDPLWSKTVKQLQDDLRTLGLKVSGKKNELILRIRNHSSEPSS